MMRDQRGGSVAPVPPPETALPSADPAREGALLTQLKRLADRSDPTEMKQSGTMLHALEQILSEIDDIMLPREVVVYCDAEPLARLVISQRRLVGLAFTEGWRGDLIDGVRRLLTLCDEGARLWFQRQVAEAPIGAESLSSLAIRRQLAPKVDRRFSPMERFVAGMGALSSGWCFAREGGSLECHGPQSTQAWLNRVLQVVPEPRGLGGRPDAMVLPAPADMPDCRLLVARADRCRFLALVRTPALGEVDTLWHMSFRAE